MMKSAIGTAGADPAAGWMDLDRVARVEVSSEESDRPVEAALLPDRGPGWRASRPWPQTVRLVFDGPRHVRRVRLRFASDGFGGSAEEVEDYRVDLPGVIELELVVTPDVSGGDARASLAELRVA